MNRAAEIVRAGGVIAYPTEAVYGLGCLPFEYAAVCRILALKGRSADKGLILIAADFGQLGDFVELPGDPQRQRILSSWPGPVTWILPVRRFVPGWLTGERDTLAVRVTAHPVARYLCERAESALVSTSANRSGRAPARTSLQVRQRFGDEIDYLLAGPLGGAARPTEIRDGRTGEVLRSG